MRSMATIEYRYLVNELQQLIGKRFSKMYFIKENIYRLKIGSTDIVCEPGKRMHITKIIEEAQEADGITEKIRKELKNSRLNGIKQINNDRVLVFEFDKGELYFEMFAKGNIIFVKDGKTVVALRNEKWADREIRTRKEYKPPKSSVVNKLEETISKKYIVSSMMKLPLGKEYVKEILRECEIDEKTPGSKLACSQKDCIETEIHKLQKKQQPYLHLKDDQIADYGLMEFSGYENQKTSTFGEALDEYYSKTRRKTSPELEKLERRLKQQKEHLLELNELEKELKAKGDYVYENYQKMENVIKICKEDPKKIEKFKVKLNKKEKTVEVEI